jgi:excisionase family DNA binding protein
MNSEILFCSKKDAAHILCVSERTLHALIAEKKLPVRRIGRRVLIRYAELKRFAERGTLKRP